MDRFIFENSTKAYFGKGCVTEQLAAAIAPCGKMLLPACGGGSIERNGAYDEVLSILHATGSLW